MPEYPQRGLRQLKPNVPEWGTSKGRFGEYGPTVYGGLGAAYETMGYIPGTSGLRAGLGEVIGYPMPKVTGEAIGQEAMDLGMPAMGFFSKAAPITRPQIWIRQQGNQFVAQSGVGAEGRMITSGKTLEEVMGKAKAMSPGHDIKVLKESPLEASKRILGSERGSFSAKPLEKKSPLTERFAVSKVPPEELAKANANPGYTPLEKIVGYVEARGEGEAQKLINQYHPSAMLSDRVEDIAVASKMGDLGLAKAPQSKAIDVPFKEVGKQKAIPEQRADYGLREKIQKLKDEGNIDELEKLIYEDPLTGVRNRRAFEEVAPVAAQQGKNFAPMDASGLKYINDTYGHKAGDTFLKEYTKALKDEGVDLYRTGGDEMVAIFGKGDYGKLKRAAHNFSNKEISINDLKGNPVTLKGAKFDFGVGKTLESGDVALLNKRAGMEAAGKRAGAGEKPVGLSEFSKEEALAELKRRRQQ